MKESDFVTTSVCCPSIAVPPPPVSTARWCRIQLLNGTCSHVYVERVSNRWRGSGYVGAYCYLDGKLIAHFPASIMLCDEDGDPLVAESCNALPKEVL
jgi:hypothetical protein